MVAVQIRKALIFSVRTCYRSVRRHPFLLGMVFFLIFLYRVFPFMFSLLVSTSPVLVSTAILLGTLLSYGKPYIPEIEKEEKTTHEIVPLKTGGPRDAIVVERDGSYNVERFTEHRRDVVEKSIQEASTTANDFSEVDKDDTLADGALLVEEKSREFQFDKRETEEGERELPDMVIEKNNVLNELKQGDGKLLENQYSSIQQFDEKSLDESENDKSPGGDVGSETVDRNCSPGSPWKQEDEREEEDDDVSDSGSDGAESSSPDASMADIIPLLDELHPLLDEAAPQLAHLSHEGSDATSEHFSKSFSDGSNELDEDIENHEEELEVGDDEEEEEETHVDKEDETKSAIRWTEDDQKNLMDLGTSELERNQRLENLIARRRLRKSMKMMAEKNLIDFDGFDFPFNVAPISTARHNPFDLPYDDMGLPPIPGSAPSILVPRRNPFDLPYDSGEEKPDLMGDDFQQEAVAHQPKEPFFRRNETFNVGPSLFGTPRHDYKFRPYFVPERMSLEGTSYSSLCRQSSELSDSKASSALETESIGSADDLEDKKPVEEDFSQEPELISMAEHPSEHVGHGSESCEDEDEDSFELGQVEKRDDAVNEIEVKLGDVEDDKEVVSSLSETVVLATPMEVNSNQIHLNTEVRQAEYSSSSSSSDVDEKIFAEKEGECFSEPLRDNLIENSAISHQPYAEKSDIDITSQLVDDTQHKEPVYDSSPTALEKQLSSSSICSDLQVEIAETSSPPVLVERTTSITERDSEVSNQSIEKNTPAIEADEKLIAANYQSPSEEFLLSRLEKEMLSPDQSVDEHYPENPEKLKDSTTYLNVLDLQEIDNRVQPNINSPETSEVTSKQSEDIETKATPGLADSEDNIIDTGENGEHISVLEHHKFPGEATDSHDDTQNNIEDINDIKEFDEGLLLELDTVGDFSVKNLGSNLNESVGESFHLSHDVSNYFGDVEGDSVIAHETRVAMDDRENLRASMVEEEISKFEGEMEGYSKSQMSGTSCIEHVDSAIKEIVHREVEDPIDYELIDDEPLAEKTAPEPADSKMVQNPNTEEINSDISVVEVQAIKDIEPSYKEAEPMDVGFGESEIPREDLISAGTEVGMPVVEAQSLEDIKLVFSQVNDREIEKPIVIESVHVELLPNETVAGHSEHKILHEGSIPAENKSDLSSSIQEGHLEQQNGGIIESPILPSSNGDDLDYTESQNAAGSPSEVHVRKARSNDDTNVALVQVSEANLEKLPKSDYEKESTENEVNEVRSGKAIEPSSEISVVLETSSGTAEKGSNEVETSEDLRISGVELKRENSHRSSSSSSSGSSSSSSDSDRE